MRSDSDTMTRCVFEEIEEPNADGWRRVRCNRCGFITAPTPSPAKNVHKICGKLGLGDYAAFGLAAFGITKERVAWVRSQFGGSGCGGCEARQEALNEAGKKIGL